MSDREDGSGRSSPGAGSYQEKSPTASEQERAPSSTGSLRESRSRSKSRSKGDRGRSPPPKRARSRTRSRSPVMRRSRSHSRDRKRYSRSRSRSPRRRSSRSSPRRRRDRSHSRSPMSNRRRHMGNREAPEVTACVGVFGLSLYTTERDLREYFGRFGPMEEVQVVHDHQTGRSRGFGFIYYKNKADAREAKDSAPGTEIDGRKIRVDYSITERAHTPTPGIYLGKPTTSRRRDFRDERRGGGYRDRGYSRRSPSPYYRERRRGYSRSRSRSRSYSPRVGEE